MVGSVSELGRAFFIFLFQKISRCMNMLFIDATQIVPESSKLKTIPVSGGLEYEGGFPGWV